MTIRNHPADLTALELETVALALVQGQKEAAHRLGISRSTVHARLNATFRRLGVVSIGEAAFVLWLRPVQWDPHGRAQTFAELVGELPGRSDV